MTVRRRWMASLVGVALFWGGLIGGGHAEAATTEIESNETVETAQTIGLNEAGGVEGTLATATDVDHYCADLAAGDYVVMVLKVSGGSLVLDTLTPSVRRIYASTTSVAGGVRWPIPVAGRHCMRVARWATSSAPVSYTVWVVPSLESGLLVQDQFGEPNDDATIATLLRPGYANARLGNLNDQVAMGKSSDGDFLLLDIPAAGTWVLQLYEFTGSPWINVMIKDPLGQPLVVNSSQWEHVIKAPGPGRYLAILGPGTGTRLPGTYLARLLAGRGNGATWTANGEFNDRAEFAMPMPPGHWNRFEQVSAGGMGDARDIVAVPVVGGRDYVVRTTPVVTPGLEPPTTMITKVSTETGELIAQCPAAGCTQLAFVAPNTTEVMVTTTPALNLPGPYWMCVELVGTACGPVPSGRTFGDFDGDTRSDMLLVTSTGRLKLAHTFAGPLPSDPTDVGGGWGAFTWLSVLPDIDGDGRTDLIGRKLDGTTWFYRGLGDGRLGVGVQAGKGWGGLDKLTVLKRNGGRPLLLARAKDGTLLKYAFVNNTGRLTFVERIGTGWQNMEHLVTVDDVSGDGVPDLLGVTKQGDLWAYHFTTATKVSGQRQIGRGWSGMRLVAAPGDMDDTGTRDLVAVRKDGTTWFYGNAGGGRFAPALQMGSQLDGVRILA